MPKQGKKAEPEKPDLTSRVLLIVDSDANNLSCLTVLLRRFDYRIHTAETAGEAFEKAKDDPPSLIITALDLKDGDGLELVRQLRKNPLYADVPFMALMNQDDLRGERRCFEAGAVDCLTRPVSPELLYRAIQAATEIRPRTCMRVRTLLPVEVNNRLFDDLDGVCTSNLSERGMFMRTATPLDVNTQLSLEIDLHVQTITVEAVVLYSDRTGKGPYCKPGMGIEFVRISPEDRELIRDFLRNEVTRGIASENA